MFSQIVLEVFDLFYVRSKLFLESVYTIGKGLHILSYYIRSKKSDKKLHWFLILSKDVLEFNTKRYRVNS